MHVQQIVTSLQEYPPTKRVGGLDAPRCLENHDDQVLAHCADAMAIARLRTCVSEAGLPALDDCARAIHIIDRLFAEKHEARSEVAVAQVLEQAFAQTTARLNALVHGLTMIGLHLVPFGSDSWFFRWNSHETGGPYPDLAETIVAAFQACGSPARAGEV